MNTSHKAFLNNSSFTVTPAQCIQLRKYFGGLWKMKKKLKKKFLDQNLRGQLRNFSWLKVMKTKKY